MILICDPDIKKHVNLMSQGTYCKPSLDHIPQHIALGSHAWIVHASYETTT